MINEIMIVGKIMGIDDSSKYKKKILMQVDRPFQEESKTLSDEFTCLLWKSIFSSVVSTCSIGDLLAVKGRMNKEDGEYFISAEKVVLLSRAH